MEDTQHVLSWNAVGGSEKIGNNLTAHLSVTYQPRILQEGRITKDASKYGLKKSLKTMVEASITDKIREFGYVQEEQAQENCFSCKEKQFSKENVII